MKWRRSTCTRYPARQGTCRKNNFYLESYFFLLQLRSCTVDCFLFWFFQFVFVFGPGNYLFVFIADKIQMFASSSRSVGGYSLLRSLIFNFFSCCSLVFFYFFYGFPFLELFELELNLFLSSIALAPEKAGCVLEEQEESVRCEMDQIKTTKDHHYQQVARQDLPFLMCVTRDTTHLLMSALNKEFW